MKRLLGGSVEHKMFGIGKIVDVEKNYFFVDFSVRKSKFIYPNSIQDGFLRLIDVEPFEIADINTNNTSKKLLTAQPIKQELLEIWKNHGFEGFIHTTELDNFKNILESKQLKPRSQLLKEEYIDRANQEVIGRTDDDIKDYCRFYYYFKTPTNYKANYKQPVALVFDENLIFEENILFTNGNAGSKYSLKTKQINEKNRKAFFWDAIFERGPYTNSILYTAYVNNRCDFGYDCIAHIRNAEFLIYGAVSIKNIVKIYFKTEQDLENCKELLSEEMMEKIIVDRSKFN